VKIGMNRRRLLAAGGAALLGLGMGRAHAVNEMEQFRPGRCRSELMN
jgi:hypothetical protein